MLAPLQAPTVQESCQTAGEKRWVSGDAHD